MKPLIFLTTAVLLLCCGYASAQKAIDTGQTRPMTRYEKAIAKIDNMNDLKIAYDTLKTEYDRRYFLHALPGYFKDHEVKTVPDWLEKAVLEGIRSKEPLYLCEAIKTAGALKIDYADNLIGLYPTIHSTFGCHEDMLKSNILISLSRMDNANKIQFFYTILTQEETPLLSATFNALIEAITANPDIVYEQKLSEYSSTLASQISQAKGRAEKDYRLPQVSEVKEKIELARNRIVKSQQGGEQ